MKKYKAIFGNPPYSIKTGDKEQNKKNIWHLFSETSINVADEVYYITPYLWNSSMNNFVNFIDNKIGKVDLTISDHFEISGSICYWNNSKQDKITIHTSKKKIEIDKMRDIKYIPFDIDNTLNIHRKGWAKKSLHSLRIGKLLADRENPLLHREKCDEYKYLVYSTSIYKLYYTNEKGLNKFGVELFKTPKIILGTTTDNTPFFDRVGEYAATHMPFIIIEDVEIRYIQLQSKFAKFWFETGRSNKNNKDNKVLSSMMYNPAMRLFPDIPLHITEDQDIYKWLDLTDDEIVVVEKYAEFVDNKSTRRKEKNDQAI